MPEAGYIILIVGVVLVLLFDFTNGFHDASNMVATAIASHTVSPKSVIGVVTVFTLLGPLLGGVAVADTIGKLVHIDPAHKAVAQGVVMSALLSAILYNIVTWKFGLPSSSSSSLTSGLVGAGVHALGSSNVNWGFAALQEFHIEGFMKVLFGLIFSPLSGFFIGYLIIKLFMKLFKRFTIRTKKGFVAFQYMSIAWLAFSFGTNDAQKGMGMIAMLLFASGVTAVFGVPNWVIYACSASITFGVMFGGWSIIKTVGFGIYRVKLYHSIADQLGSAAVILGSSMIGAPVSTTQVVTTTLIGVGTGEHPHHVKWKNVGRIFTGWILNIPISMVVGYTLNMLLSNLF